jgi:serine protease Do
MNKIISGTIIGFTSGLMAVGAYKLLEPKQKSDYKIQSSLPVLRTALDETGSAGLTDFTFAADKTVHAVVHVKTNYAAQQVYNPFSDFFGGQKYYNNAPQQASGSGVIISNDGYIVTNNHVVNNAESIEIVTNENKTYTGTVIGTDPETDLAVVKINEKDLPFLSFGNSDNVKIGEWVLAVGNPFNLTSTVTAGIVSAKARNINLLEYDPNKDIFPIESFIQTDAAVNPGNSGGALANTNGDLIGINTAIASQTGSYSGYSFAVPANLVKKVTNDLIEYGAVQRAYIGVNITNITQDLVDEKSLPTNSGAYVKGTIESGAAAAAGIKEGDIIIKVADINVKNSTELQEQVGKYRPGDNIKVTVLRDNKEKEFNVTLKNKDGNTKIKKPEDDAKSTEVFGAKLESVSVDELKKLNIASGVKISDLNDGVFRNNGIKEGFIITHIDRQRVARPEDVNNYLKNKRGGVLIEGIYPNGVSAYYGIGIEK